MVMSKFSINRAKRTAKLTYGVMREWTRFTKKELINTWSRLTPEVKEAWVSTVSNIVQNNNDAAAVFASLTNSEASAYVDLPAETKASYENIVVLVKTLYPML
jgi:hypothetical protein